MSLIELVIPNIYEPDSNLRLYFDYFVEFVRCARCGTFFSVPLSPYMANGISQLNLSTSLIDS